METACHLSLFVRDGRGVFPLRRTDVCHEIWLVDLRWFPGNVGIGYPILGYTQGYSYPFWGWVGLGMVVRTLSSYEWDTPNDTGIFGNYQQR